MSSTRTAPSAFDGIAAQYDELFTNSVIGRAQRNSVWEIARKHLPAGGSVLELNCGTGEDAFFLAKCGMKVLACDVSEKMIEIARCRQAEDPSGAAVRFRVLATERIAAIVNEKFDAAFSNFSGLNCVADLGKTAAEMAQRLRPGATAVLCFSNRYCLWELVWYLLRGTAGKAFRRWTRKPVVARIGNESVTVRYPSVAEIASAFSPYFRPVCIYGVGITVPPSYLEPWLRHRPAMVAAMSRLDAYLSTLWPFRLLGDHVALVLERTER
jgi:SAM-dependent methyltransferase